MSDFKITKVYKFILDNMSNPAFAGCVERGRLDRAYQLAISNDPLTKYGTTWEECKCKDAEFHETLICKHRLAFMLRNNNGKIQAMAFLEESLIGTKEGSI